MAKAKAKTAYQVATKQTAADEQQPLIKADNGARADINFEGELWEAAVALRGNIAPADYKHFVLPLLFLRYLSLKYERRRAVLEQAIKDEQSDYFTTDAAIAQEILNDPLEYKKEGVFIVPEKARWDYLVKHAQDDDIAIKLDDAMELLEQTYPELRGVLPRKYAGSNLSRENVTGLVNLFARDVFKADAGRESDLLGRVYEYFITNFASTEGTRGGEFFTPRAIVKLLVAMMEPTQGQIFDPACGSGGMFVQSDIFARHSGNLSFFGQENVDTTLRLCKMNLLLHGLNGDIKQGNSLLDDKHADLRADFVIANPPFNLDGWGAERVSPNDQRLQIGERKCLPTNSNANYFWMMHFLYHLKDGGTAGTVMANGAMTTSLTEEKAVRVALVEAGFVDCIVQLPDKLFFGTGIPACLWFLSKNRDGQGQYRPRQNEILFIDARKKGVMVNRRQRVLTDDQIAEIAAVYHHYRDVEGARQEVAGFCKTATLDEVRAHDYKLTPGIYVGTEQIEDDGIPFDVKMAELTAQLKAQFAESNVLQVKIVRELEL
ncbi:MAG: class I SAM-dependent DNA methyltransferase, partial [Chloroflexota bacterium]